MSDPFRYVPRTPGGSCLIGLSAATEDEAWENLVASTSHMSYQSVKDLKERGYTVEDHADDPA